MAFKKLSLLILMVSVSAVCFISNIFVSVLGSVVELQPVSNDPLDFLSAAFLEANINNDNNTNNTNNTPNNNNNIIIIQQQSKKSPLEIIGCNMSELMLDRVNFKKSISWSDNLTLSIATCSLEKIDVDLTQRCLAPRGIQMIGDSVTRYQYLNLVHFLATGKWASDPSKPNELEKLYSNWNDFYLVTNQRLLGHEICDCGRDNVAPTVENRYFQKGSLVVSYRQFLNGLYTLLAHDVSLLNLSSCATNKCQQAFCAPGLCMHNTATDLGLPMTPGVLSTLIHSHSGKDVFLNGGIWWNANGRNSIEDHTEFLKEELGLVQPEYRVHWKMTTANLLGLQPEYKFTDTMLMTLNTTLRQFYSVFDSHAITAALVGEDAGRAGEALFDDVHFYPPVYVGLNQALIAYLCTLSADSS